MTPTIPEAAVHAAAKAIRRSGDTYTEMAQAALTAALPFLQGVNVAHGTGIGVLRVDDYGQFEEFECATDLKLPAGSYDLVIDVKPPSPRAQALEEALKAMIDIGTSAFNAMHHYAQINPTTTSILDGLNTSIEAAIRALSHPVSPDMGVERPVEGGWLPIETAPKDTVVDLWCVHTEHAPSLCRDATLTNGQWSSGYFEEPLNAGWIPTHWRPLPQAPGVAV